jgi:hypothetical protein
MEPLTDNNFVTLKLLGFNDTEKASFASILTLAERGLKKRWTVSSMMPADFYLVKERLIAQMDQHEILKSLPRHQCIFIRSKRDDFNVGGHQLYWGESEVPSLRLLVEFLNGLDNPSREAEIQQPISIPDSGFFDPEQGFLGHLLMSANGPRVFRPVNQQDSMVLYVDADSKSYYSNVSLEQLKPYFLSTDELKVENLSSHQLQAAVADQSLKPSPLNHLVWFAAFTCSQGKVIKGYQKGDIVQLKRWPDINLPGCKQLIKLAAYMHSNAVDLDTVHANTSIPVAQIHDFYNACKVINLIVHSDTTDIHQKHLNAEQKQLFAKIGERLNQAVQLNTQN